MSILGRWSNDDRRPIFAVLLEDEDRRSIQAMLRGAEQSAPADARMRGLVPTSTLSERALQVLSRQPTIADVVRMLVLWKHPFGHALLHAVAGQRPSLFDLEVALQRAFAHKALAHARKAGPDLLGYARQVVDLMNAWSVLLHFPEHEEHIEDAVFIEGGSLLDRETFESLMNEESFERAREGVARAFEDSPLNAALSADRELATMEGAVLRAQIAQQKQAARLRPAGAAPLVLFMLELRAEVADLRRIIWGIVLGTPTAFVQSNMVAS
jgi:vacuolar-type H+-ATPase subunit C/Vma6